MYKISKDFSGCYGHRVWSQHLNADYCENGDNSCKCKHLHGHEGLITVNLSSKTLERGMVSDFKHLGWAKNLIDTVIDHKFIIDLNDPMYNSIVGYYEQDSVDFTVGNKTLSIGSKIDPNEFNKYKCDSSEIELLESFFIVDFVPTSENLCKWFYDIVDYFMSDIAVVDSVEWAETPKSKAIYYGE